MRLRGIFTARKPIPLCLSNRTKSRKKCTGQATNALECYRETNEKVRAKCDIIIQNSMAPPQRYGVSINDGLVAIEAGPEMCSLDVAAIVVTFGGVELENCWTRDWLRNACRLMNARGIKPELELFSPQGMEDLKNFLIPEGLVAPPYSCTFVMGMNKVSQGSMEYSPENLMHMRSKLPTNAFFTVMGVGQYQLEATMMSMLLGGNVRVGFEDNIYYKKGELAKSNAQLVKRIVAYARDLGLEIATPAEARSMLGLPQLSERKQGAAASSLQG